MTAADDDPLALEAFRDAMDDILEEEGRVELWIEPPPDDEPPALSAAEAIN
jgi:hypothetical protein